jgi:FAD synthetase
MPNFPPNAPQELINNLMKRKKVLVFGTFDGLHKGHLNFFKQARKFGDYLVVVVGRDSTIKKVKGRLPKFSEQERLKRVRRNKLVNEAHLGNQRSYYKKIKETKPQIICLGYDQTSFTENLEKEIEKFKMKIEIVRLKPYQPKKYKSSLLNKKPA